MARTPFQANTFDHECTDEQIAQLTKEECIEVIIWYVNMTKFKTDDEKWRMVLDQIEVSILHANLRLVRNEMLEEERLAEAGSMEAVETSQFILDAQVAVARLK